MIRRLVLVCLLALSSACSQLPKPELQAYRDAFDAAQTAAEPLIADYAAAERVRELRRLQAAPGRGYSSSTPYFVTFDPGDAAARATIGLPPGADAVQRAFGAVAAYNDTLVAIAENRNIEEARGQLRQIVADVGAVVPVGAPTLAIADKLTGVIESVFRPAIEAGNREIFRQKVLEGYDPMVGLLDLLVAHSSNQYATTISPLLIKIENSPSGSDTSDMAAKINDWHQVYADYVVLLRGAKERLRELKLVLETPRSAPLLARASAGSAEFRAYAEGLRRSLADLHARP